MTFSRALARFLINRKSLNDWLLNTVWCFFIFELALIAFGCALNSNSLNSIWNLWFFEATMQHFNWLTIATLNSLFNHFYYARYVRLITLFFAPASSISFSIDRLSEGKSPQNFCVILRQFLRRKKSPAENSFPNGPETKSTPILIEN